MKKICFCSERWAGALSVILGELRWVRWDGGRKGWRSWWAMVNRPLDHWARGPISTPQLQLLSPTKIRRWFKGCSESPFWIPLTQSHVTGSSASQFSEHYQLKVISSSVEPQFAASCPISLSKELALNYTTNDSVWLSKMVQKAALRILGPVNVWGSFAFYDSCKSRNSLPSAKQGEYSFPWFC